MNNKRLRSGQHLSQNCPLSKPNGSKKTSDHWQNREHIEIAYLNPVGRQFLMGGSKQGKARLSAA
eukprot:15316035-Heterocapsa_arctica.AAC.1